MNIIGQVHNAKYFPAEPAKEGKAEKKAWFTFSLATRKPGKLADGEYPNVFTTCNAHGSLADRMNEHFGKPEHKGKWICVYGSITERAWQPDIANEKQRATYATTISLTKEMLEGLGFKLAADSIVQKNVFSVGKQIDKQIFVNGFEFVGSSTTTPSAPAPSSVGFAAAPDDAAPSTPAVAGEGVPVGTGDDDLPF